MLKASTVANEYYFGDMPGTLQYNIDPKDICNVDLSECHNVDLSECHNVDFLECHNVNLSQIIPHTKGDIDWKIILAMKANIDNKISDNEKSL